MKKFLIGILISGVFLWLVLQKVNLKQTVKIISTANFIYILLILLLYIPVLTIRGLRWKTILNVHEKIPTINFIQGICISQMTNNLIPFRAGDFAQAYFLNFKSNINIARVFSSVFLERVIDFTMLTIIAISGLSFAFLPTIIEKEKIFVVILIVIVVVYLVFTSEQKITMLINKILPESKLKEKVLKAVTSFYTGLHSIKSPKTIIIIASYTIFLWFLTSLSTYFVLRAVNINLGILPAMVIFAITSLNFALPASPGNIGTYEFFAMTAVSIFLQDKTHALSFALLSHIISWLPMTLLGVVVVLSSGISFSTFSRKSHTGVDHVGTDF